MRGFVQDVVVFSCAMQLLKSFGVFNVENWLGMRADTLSVQATLFARAGTTAKERWGRHLTHFGRVTSIYDP